MKTSLKISVLVTAVMFSISSCSSCGSKKNSEEPAKIDSPKTSIDTTKAIDTSSKATGTVKKDSF